MASPTEETNVRDELITLAGFILSITASDLVQTERLGRVLDFSNGRTQFEKIRSLCSDLYETELKEVPFHLLDTICKDLREIRSLYQQILNFTVQDNNSARQRSQILAQVDQHFSGLYCSVAPIFAYGMPGKLDFQSHQKSIDRAIADMDETRKIAEAQIYDAQHKLDEILASARKASAEVGIAEYSIHFQIQAEEHLKSSFKWLGTTVLLALATLGISIALAIYHILHPANWTTVQAFQVGVAKIFGLSILYFATIWAGRMYKAHWHNYVVNKHRQNALSTFEAFVAATKDEQTKNAVLLQATQSIFSHLQSGFIAGESDSGNPSQILEIVRGVSSSKSA